MQSPRDLCRFGFRKGEKDLMILYKDGREEPIFCLSTPWNVWLGIRVVGAGIHLLKRKDYGETR